MGTMADFVQMWMAFFQSKPSRQPPFTETTFLPCSEVRLILGVEISVYLLGWCEVIACRNSYKSSYVTVSDLVEAIET